MHCVLTPRVTDWHVHYNTTIARMCGLCKVRSANSKWVQFSFTCHLTHLGTGVNSQGWWAIFGLGPYSAFITWGLAIHSSYLKFIHKFTTLRLQVVKTTTTQHNSMQFIKTYGLWMLAKMRGEGGFGRSPVMRSPCFFSRDSDSRVK